MPRIGHKTAPEQNYSVVISRAASCNRGIGNKCGHSKPSANSITRTPGRLFELRAKEMKDRSTGVVERSVRVIQDQEAGFDNLILHCKLLHETVQRHEIKASN